MTLDERLATFCRKSVNEALRDLRRSKEVRNLVKEVMYHGTEEDKLRLVQHITKVRPDLLPPLVNAPVALYEKTN